MKDNNIGIVETKIFKINETIELESSNSLDNVEVAYETYGKLNKDKSNAILVCHALTGDAHAAGFHKGDKKPGWWNIAIGPRKSLDSEKYFIICSNVLGGCKGTTGPSSINPVTGKEYASDFPEITIKDMVNVQKKLIDSFGINKLAAVVGGSMGGMQVLQWACSYPEMVKKAVPIATTGRSSPQQIAFNKVGREAIRVDSNWNNGYYYDSGNIPKNGLSVARKIAHITYYTDKKMDSKFGRSLKDEDNFQVESYLDHQGEVFVKRFDANSYICLTKAVDLFDLAINDSLIDGLKEIKAKFEIISINSDWLYPVEQGQELFIALKANNVDVTYSEIQSLHGHDAFLLEKSQLNALLSSFLSDNKVLDLMKTDVPTIKVNSTVKEAAELMFNEQVTHLPVVTSDNILLGIVTSWDISKSIVTNSSNLNEVMTQNVKSCRNDESIKEIANKMRECDISCLPVVSENNNLEGLITIDQISHLISKY